ncbi:OmpA family protein [Micromonospora rifamycinica]|uniref:Outer membrane protein OmpA n=1 Tax=Micromonospora rifamycinica TaxID=291594 RepID=A0A109IMR8_9ACTN|nr:OmpA family protein [Micromonospora rifamycinica]KWV33359.1 hypothetical protein AWV63_07460 [Micromonospora rifamycinica]SCG74347.1 Outer membrane protein OmpA [Micromonospora rifamycinica]
MARKKRSVVAVVAALTLTITGCADEPAPEPPVTSSLACPAAVPGAGPAAVTLIVGARANNPRPDLPKDVRRLVESAAKGGQEIRIVRLDGEPSIALTATFESNQKNDARNDSKLDDFMKRTLGVVQKLEPKVAEADGLAALAEAGRITPEGGLVVFLDSGLSTAGALSFTDVAMFSAEPADVSAFLRKEELMPGLSGRTVVFVGLGNTADPQPVLNGKLRGRVTAIWEAVARDAGATCVDTLAADSRRTAVDRPVPVSVVALPAPPRPPERCGTTVLADSNSVGFVVDTARLREPEEGRKVLRQLADQLNAGDQRILLVGVTSSEGGRARNVKLSQDRAAAIRTELVKLGVDAGRIRIRGDGPGGRYFTRDVTGEGVLIPAAAARNRAVVVELTCPRS